MPVCGVVVAWQVSSSAHLGVEMISIPSSDRIERRMHFQQHPGDHLALESLSQPVRESLAIYQDNPFNISQKYKTSASKSTEKALDARKFLYWQYLIEKGPFAWYLKDPSSSAAWCVGRNAAGRGPRSSGLRRQVYFRIVSVVSHSFGIPVGHGSNHLQCSALGSCPSQSMSLHESLAHLLEVSDL